MLFHIKQTHAPADCPFGHGGSRSLFQSDHPYVRVQGFWLAFPQHTTYLVVETDDIAHLQDFLKPGAGVTTCEITPVSDRPVAPNRQPLRGIAGYFLSHDGVAEAPDRFITAQDDETESSGANLIATQDVVILGRRTYDEWAARDDPRLRLTKLPPSRRLPRRSLAALPAAP